MANRLLAKVYRILRNNRFMVALFLTLALSFLVPDLGAKEGPLHAGTVSRLGIMVIFFFQGLTLKTRQLAGGLKDIRLHAFVQGWIFLISPFFLGAAAILMRFLGAPELSHGFLYLALVPTTISSAVALTGMANGNVPSAIFNTSLSNIIGVFWVPTGCLLLFSAGSGLDAGQLLPLLFKLTKLILIPLAVGQVCRPFVFKRSWFALVSPYFRQISQSIILFTVFSAFCESILSNTWSSISPAILFGLLITVALCVVLIHASVWATSAWFFRKYSDRVCAFFCGSQKTLASGVPMAVAIFSTTGTAFQSSLGLILLPLLCYHPMQLLLAGVVLPQLND